MNHAINDEALDLVFRRARTFRKFRPDPVTPQMLMAVYDLLRLGPTSGNCCPARIMFVDRDEPRPALAQPMVAVGVFTWPVAAMFPRAPES